MKKTLRDLGIAVAMALSAIAILLAVITLMHTLTPVQASAVEVPVVEQTGGFDTSIIEDNWCGDFSDGTIRMVGAWQYERQLVEDETGNVWYIEEPVQADDFLLLWIADNHTPDNAEDDIIVKVWREAH
jgi:hypothetical protein